MAFIPDIHANIYIQIGGGKALGLNTQSVNFGPNAITSVEGKPVSFSEDEQFIEYTSFKKVKEITEGSLSLVIKYGIDEQRRKASYSGGIQDGLTRYYFNNYEEEHKAGEVKKVHYISGGNGLTALYIETNGIGKLYHAITDYQGSLIALTDKSGNMATYNGSEQKFAYDPWGNRRDPQNWTLKDNRTSLLTDRGYTMHEHLDAFGLINMNGRVYDPLLAQFLSPDPHITYPGNALNYNRYAYGLNNPLMYSDPSGENPLFFILPSLVNYVAGILDNTINHGQSLGNAVSNSYIGVGGYLSPSDLTYGNHQWDNHLYFRQRSVMINYYYSMQDRGIGYLPLPTPSGSPSRNYATSQHVYAVRYSNGNMSGTEVASSSGGVNLMHWASAIYRMKENMPPDAWSHELTVDGVYGAGYDQAGGQLTMLRGKDTGVSKGYTSIGTGPPYINAVGLDYGLSWQLTSYYFVGDVSKMGINDFLGRSYSFSVGASWWIEVGGGYLIAPVENKGYIIGKTVHLGVSPPGVSGHIGVGQTNYFTDWGNFFSF
ncbi:RHS repeat-associated core domain-containing protein [Saccharicrinis carchari]|uniref:RHS repeat-associated core domain-containing protein n=1 Tax=Saccharicrinis carchari TaxID=1168039 RepID=A0A521CRY5_SACCC|nr:RHS repeat-associated core domain-containing protein [Saccharicrinis carchari]SMO62192.1 RHS repeat-associated core domain-containing protein [Saccharicrinis carchari]